MSLIILVVAALASDLKLAPAISVATAALIFLQIQLGCSEDMTSNQTIILHPKLVSHPYT